MTANKLVGYVGDPDIHDATIVGVQQHADTARVTLRGVSGRIFDVRFRGVQLLTAHRPEGMVVYALCETKGPTGQSRFVFANWEDSTEDGASLEIIAQEVEAAGTE
jgi:hypothetical protein